MAISTESRPVLATLPQRPSRTEKDGPIVRANSEDTMKLLRREFLHLVAGAAAVPASCFSSGLGARGPSTRPSRNGTACDMAKHRVARSRSGSL